MSLEENTKFITELQAQFTAQQELINKLQTKINELESKINNHSHFYSREETHGGYLWKKQTEGCPIFK